MISFFDVEGNELASARLNLLAGYCLARAWAGKGNWQAAAEVLLPAGSRPQGTFFEGDVVRSLSEAWARLEDDIGNRP